MTGREALYSVVGAIAGVAVGYIVTKAMYEKEIEDIYAEFNEEREEAAEEALATYQGKPGTRHLRSVRPDDDIDRDTSNEQTAVFPSGAEVTVHLERPIEDHGEIELDDLDEPVYGATACVDGIDVVFDETHKVWVTADEHVLWEGPDPDSGADTDEELAQTIENVNDVHIIPAEDIRATNQVIGEFNHETGEVRISPMLTPNFKNLGLDDVISNDALPPLIGDVAFEELMDADEDVNNKRLVCVRNNVLNLDFVVSY